MQVHCIGGLNVDPTQVVWAAPPAPAAAAAAAAEPGQGGSEGGIGCEGDVAVVGGRRAEERAGQVGREGREERTGQEERAGVGGRRAERPRKMKKSDVILPIVRRLQQARRGRGGGEGGAAGEGAGERRARAASSACTAPHVSAGHVGEGEGKRGAGDMCGSVVAPTTAACDDVFGGGRFTERETQKFDAFGGDRFRNLPPSTLIPRPLTLDPPPSTPFGGDRGEEPGAQRFNLQPGEANDADDGLVFFFDDDLREILDEDLRAEVGLTRVLFVSDSWAQRAA